MLSLFIPGTTIGDWASIVQALLLICALLVGARQWHKQLQAEQLDRLQGELASIAGDLRYIFTHDYSRVDQLSPEADWHAKKVVDAFSHVHQQIERRFLDSDLVFGKCYPSIIRAEKKLRGYVKHKEQIGGNRYGRRLRTLARFARIYHDVWPQHRMDESGKLRAINFYGSKRVIHQTRLRKGWRGVIQQIGWLYRRITRNYSPDQLLPLTLSRLLKEWGKSYIENRIEATERRSHIR